MAGKKENLAEDNTTAPIIIKRGKKHQHAHHGGAWKIAFADFVTAMMAFFLLMWLLASLNKAQREGLSDFFKQPVRIALMGGDSMGTRSNAIAGGGKNIEEKDGVVSASNQPINVDETTAQVLDPGNREQDVKNLEQLKSNITLSMAQDPSLSDLKDQLLMDVVADGLRIQLIDNNEQPMFGMGSDKMAPEMEKILEKIAILINNLPNKVSIQGHTDAHPFHNPEALEQTNWELSTQRANAARRALVTSGMSEDKILRITGYANTILLDKENAFSSKNRRISIIVMTHDSASTLLENQ
ncbi:MAG: flagellar motor protein MotB [Legionellaceae bacterium]|nr:flagellar motor protein MotB [Legionellaceae bacterium]